MEKKNDNKVVIIIMSIVILVLVGVIVYMFTTGNYTNSNQTNNNIENNESNDSNKEDSNKENNQESGENNENVYKTLSLTDPLVEKLYDYVTVNPGMNEVVDFFSKYGTITNKEIPNKIKLSIALTVNKMGDDFEYLKTQQGVHGEEKIYVLGGDAVVNKINNIFGKNNGYTHINDVTSFPFSATTKGVCARLKYDSASNMYQMIEEPGCGGIVAHFVHNKLVSAEKNNDTIVLTQKIYMVSAGKAYKTIGAEDVISDNCEMNCENDLYFEQGATTKYTFKLGDNGNYYFESKVTY